VMAGVSKGQPHSVGYALPAGPVETGLLGKRDTLCPDNGGSSGADYSATPVTFCPAALRTIQRSRLGRSLTRRLLSVPPFLRLLFLFNAVLLLGLLLPKMGHYVKTHANPVCTGRPGFCHKSKYRPIT
jgi:hypothetical protein